MDAGHEVLWLAPGLKSSAGETFLPMSTLLRWLPGPLGWIPRLLISLRRHRARLQGVDAVFTLREYDALGLKLYPKTRGMPHVYFSRGDAVEVYGFLAAHEARWYRRLKMRMLLSFYAALQKALLPRLNVVITQAQFLADLMAGRIPDLDRRMVVLPNDCRIFISPTSVTPAHRTAVENLRQRGDLLIGVFAQAFWTGKGFDVFFEVMRRLPETSNIKAVIFSYGQDESLIAAAAADPKLAGKILYLGRAEQARDVMPLVDLVVVPTRFFDACPNVVLETLAAERMILASDIAGHRAQLIHDDLLFENENLDDLAAKVLALESNPSMREVNRRRVQDRRRALDFDWNAAVVRITEGVARGQSIPVGLDLTAPQAA